MYLVTPKTDIAKNWIKDNIVSEPWQWLGNRLAVDHHYIEDLELGMLDAGLTTNDVTVEHC